MLNKKTETLSNLFLDGFIQANYCHKTLFKSEMTDNDQTKNLNLMCSLAYLTEAHTLFTTAKIFISENKDTLGCYLEFDNFIHQFFVFNKEVLDNIRTNHSHQWSDIEFRELAKAFRSLGNILDINNLENIVEKALNE